MNLLQLLFSGRTSKFLILYNFVGVTLIFLQCNSSVNSSRIQDLNLTNGDYVSEILRRSKRHAMACKTPNYGLHTKYTILGEITKTSQPGDYVKQYNNLEVSCDRGYNLTSFSNKRTLCINGQWNPPLTINCLRTCPSLKSTMSTSVTCKYDNIPLENCNNPIEGTTASLSCNPLFEQDDLQNNQIRVCKAGRWTPSISECYAICGTKRSEGIPAIVNGQDAIIGDYPWQIAIYNAKKIFICGGSIIDRHIILTAAHCLTDHSGKVNSTNDYLIAAGKYYREYDDDRDEFVQYSKVKQIYVPERYTGLINHYVFDIAIILLADPFTISLRVQPVCIELRQESPHSYLSLNSNCIVTGWGHTKEGRELSDVLKELTIPFIPYRKCFEEVPKQFQKYVTTDKICGGYLNNKTSVCQGDSGGALVFRNTLNYRYYVKGIVSTSPATAELVCDSDQYSLYTSVKEHVGFITNVLTHNQIPQSIEFTDEATDENESDIHSCRSEHFISEMLHQVSSTPPQILPEVAEITIYASSTFELRCLSKNSVTWTFPNNLEEIFPNENLTKYSTITIKSSKCDSVYESRLNINNASYLDVGFYYCHENTTGSTENSSIYIYVHDNEKLFLMPDFQTRTVNEYSKVILPCRPTAPDVRVQLSIHSGDELILNSQKYIMLLTAYGANTFSISFRCSFHSSNNNTIPLNYKRNNYVTYVTYDSKIGFTYMAGKREALHTVPYDFACTFSRGLYEQSARIDQYTEVIPNKPMLLWQIPNKHVVVVGQKLEILCKAHHKGKVVPISWISPDPDAIMNKRMQIFSAENDVGAFGVEMQSTLIIEHAETRDKGNYTCIVKTVNNLTNSSTIFIEVSDETV